MAVTLKMANHRRDACAPPDLASDGRRDAALVAQDHAAAVVGVVVAIAASTEARSTDTPLNRSAWATWAARMWPLRGCGNRKDCLPGHGCRAAKFGLLGREQPGRNRQAPAQRPGEGVTLQGWLQHRHDFARYFPAPYRRLA